jgi:hypothetical protein
MIGSLIIIRFSFTALEAGRVQSKIYTTFRFGYLRHDNSALSNPILADKKLYDLQNVQQTFFPGL